jgi:hypothetical protein
MPPEGGHPGFSSWLAGLVIGVGGGFLVLIFPTLGLVLVGLGVVGVLRARRRRAGGSGLLIGIGATIIVLLTRAQLECEAVDAAPNQGCNGPDLTPFFVVSGVLVALGLVLAAAGLIYGRTGRGESS